jgi:hypothetical protein
MLQRHLHSYERADIDCVETSLDLLAVVTSLEAYIWSCLLYVVSRRLKKADQAEDVGTPISSSFANPNSGSSHAREPLNEESPGFVRVRSLGGLCFSTCLRRDGAEQPLMHAFWKPLRRSSWKAKNFGKFPFNTCSS